MYQENIPAGGKVMTKPDEITTNEEIGFLPGVTDDPANPNEHVLADDYMGATSARIDELNSQIDAKKAEYATAIGVGNPADMAVANGQLDQLQNDLQAGEDLRDYLKTRDTMVDKHVHDASSGKFKKTAEANRHPELEYPPEVDEYETMPLFKPGGLIDLWAGAESRHDKTTALNIEDELIRRIENNPKITNDKISGLIDRLDAIKEERKSKLNPNDEPASHPGEDGTDNTAQLSELAGKLRALIEQRSRNEAENVAVTVRRQAPAIPQPEDLNKAQVADSGEFFKIKPQFTVAPQETEAANLATESKNTLFTTKPSQEASTAIDESKADDEVDKTDASSDAMDPEEDPATNPDNAPVVNVGERQREYDQAVERYAYAKIESEKMLARKGDKSRLEEAASDLSLKFHTFMDSLPEMMRAADDSLVALKDRAIKENIEFGTSLAELEERKANGETLGGEIDQQIKDLKDKIEFNQLAVEGVEARLAKREIERNAFMASQVIKLRHTIDSAVLNARVERHPKLARLNNWLMKHPKTRLGVGLALTGMGFAGAATLNAPLVATSLVGKGLLRGYGSYNTVRSLGDLLASRRMNRTEMSKVDDYLEASRKESGTRRNSKRLATTASAVALAPIVSGVIDKFQAPSPKVIGNGAHHEKIPQSQYQRGVSHKAIHHHGGQQSIRPNPGGKQAPSPEPLTTPPADNLRHLSGLQPVGGGELPWDFAINNLHTNISDPGVLSRLVNNKLGISFVGNGLSGGNGAIESVAFNGHTYTDNGHINAAIKYILETGTNNG